MLSTGCDYQTWPARAALRQMSTYPQQTSCTFFQICLTITLQVNEKKKKTEAKEITVELGQTQNSGGEKLKREARENKRTRKLPASHFKHPDCLPTLTHATPDITATH